jgi:hypothetical protein
LREPLPAGPAQEEGSSQGLIKYLLGISPIDIAKYYFGNIGPEFRFILTLFQEAGLPSFEGILGPRLRS